MTTKYMRKSQALKLLGDSKSALNPLFETTIESKKYLN